MTTPPLPPRFRAVLVAFLLATSLLPLPLAADGSLPRSTRQELQTRAADLFQRSYAGEVSFVETRLGTGFSGELEGCPAESLLNGTAGETRELTITTGEPGRWAGSTDGINTTATLNGISESVSGFITPSNLPRQRRLNRGILDDQVVNIDTFNASSVERPEIEQVSLERIGQIFSCLSKLNKNSYRPGELDDQCTAAGAPLSEYPTREEVGQTCFTDTTIYLVPNGENSDVFDATMNITEKCDFVAWNLFAPSAEPTINFSPCRTDVYTGEVTFMNENSPSIRKQLRKGARRFCRPKRKARKGKKLRGCIRRILKKNRVL
ncbi:hypothetical protein MRY87_13315 [bacterium]|nr:hypothetical protein [bacterium]